MEEVIKCGWECSHDDGLIQQIKYCCEKLDTWGHRIRSHAIADVITWKKRLEESGAGEIMIRFMNQRTLEP